MVKGLGNVGAHLLPSVLCRFGLCSLPVLQAIEGLEGVADCKEYSFVEERHSWKAHLGRIKKEATTAKNSALFPNQKKAPAEKVEHL